MGKLGTFVLGISIIVAMLFLNTLHAVIPHDHGSDNILAESMHAAIRLADVDIPVGAFAALFFVYVRRPVSGGRERLTPLTAYALLTYRGISKHRRFG